MSLLFICVTTNTAAVTTQSFTLPLMFEHESNPAFSVTDKLSINRVISVPDYSILINQGAEQWLAKASLRIERSSDQSISQDRNDPSLNLGWKHDYETGQFGLELNANEQSTRVSEFVDTEVVSGDNTRKTRTLFIFWLNTLSDRTSLMLDGTVTNVSFNGQITAGLVNSSNELINAKLNYLVSDKMEMFSHLSFSHFIPEDPNIPDSEIKGINLGLKWNINEKLIMSTSAGTSEIKSVSNIQSTSNNKTWQAMLNMQYSTLRTSSHLNLTRSLSPGSTGSLNETNQFIADWTYNLSERDNVAVEFRWGQNLSLNKIETKSLSVNYARQISLAWDFRLSATHRNRDDKIVSVGSNSVMASIIYKLPDF